MATVSEQGKHENAKNVVVLITGVSRGIGNALFSTYLQRPNHTVIGTLRDVTNIPEKLTLLPTGLGSSAIFMKLDSNSTTDPFEGVEQLKSQYDIERLDVVIANAGISKYFGKAMVTPAQEMSDHFDVNAVAPLLLFQATEPLLRKSTTSPKFVVISSGAGSLAGVDKLPVENTAYGASKAALNFVTRRIHHENPRLVAFPINPGWLQTDLGNHAATGAGMSVAPVSVQDGVNGVIEQIDKATRAGTSGKFMTYSGEQLDW